MEVCLFTFCTAAGTCHLTILLHIPVMKEGLLTLNFATAPGRGRVLLRVQNVVVASEEGAPEGCQYHRGQVELGCLSSTLRRTGALESLSYYPRRVPSVGIWLQLEGGMV